MLQTLQTQLRSLWRRAIIPQVDTTKQLTVVTMTVGDKQSWG